MKKRISWNKYHILFITLLFSSLFFMLLGRFNSKANRSAPQAVNGLLVVNDTDLDTWPLRYLRNGWAFYPDVLLTPADFKNGDPNLYMNYISLNDYTHFDHFGTRDNPHGCGTYVLHLSLPETAATYALEIPEIFSSYQLYLDDQLTLQCGNPNPDQYEAATQKRLITFEKSGFVTLILAVSDFSHIYSGLIYPPAFGTPLALNYLRGFQLSFCLILETLALIAALFSLYLGIHMKEKNTLLFSILCLSTFGFTAYPLLHTFRLAVFPWYALEISCGYLTTFLVIVLHNRITCSSSAQKRISNSISFLFFVFMLAESLLASHLSVSVMHLVSILIMLYKFGAASYLFISSWLYLKRQNAESVPLFLASIFYGCSLLWDRILPSYEPVIGGWFSEWGSLSLVLAIGYTLMHNIMQYYSYSLAFAAEHHQIKRQLAMQTEYTRQISENNKERQRMMHDFRQHIRTLTMLAQNSGCSEIETYLTTLEGSLTIHQSAPVYFCGNAAVNALLHYYYERAGQSGIQIELHLDLPKPFPLSDISLCTVVGNLLENALEACERQKNEKKTIFMNGQVHANFLFILLENSCDSEPKHAGSQYLSSKSQSGRIGIGVASARKILESCGGTLEQFYHDGIFTSEISIPVDLDVIQ